MKIAVTGATGELGKAVIRELITQIAAEDITGISRNPENNPLPGIDYRKGDYNNYEQYLEALSEIDRLLIISSNDYPEKRPQQHRNVIKAAQEQGVKRIVYSSIIGNPDVSAFAPVVSSNRKTEEDIRNSGIPWLIGRNGLYIEPDLEYIDAYKAEGKIVNCAGPGKCAYTSRKELARAYALMLTGNRFENETFNLVGESVSQDELAKALSEYYGIDLSYQYVSVERYLVDRRKALGDLYGNIVGGIYHSIHEGFFDVSSDFLKLTGRMHHNLHEMIVDYSGLT